MSSHREKVYNKYKDREEVEEKEPQDEETQRISAEESPLLDLDENEN
jgi:hypothetical protein